MNRIINRRAVELIDKGAINMIDNIFKFCENNLSDKELEELYEWVNKSERNKILFAEIKNYYASKEIANSVKQSRAERERVITQIYENQGWYRKVTYKPNLVPLAVQLAMTFVVVFAIVFGMNRFNRNEREKSAAQYLATNIKSANSKAILVLSNGQEMLLGVKEGVGAIANKNKSEKFEIEDNGSKVKINDRSQIDKAKSQRSNDKLEKQKSKNSQKNNTISTELGGYYNAILPDGSEVWINSKSTLSFADDFGIDQRKVSLSGEAYFSIKKIEGIPFIVEIGDKSVKVLGTEFNVKAYKEETILQLSLINGAVEFKDNTTGYSHSLQPNRELVFDFLTGKVVERSFDPYIYNAWKEGYFLFVNSNIKEVVQKISRWFNIEVKLENDEYDSKLFNGKVSREQGIMPIMSKLQLSYKFRYYMEKDILIIK